MIQADALARLKKMDDAGTYIHLRRELKRLFGEPAATFAKTLERLVQSGILIRAARGVYVFAYSKRIGISTLESIVQYLRRSEYNYLSYESALAEHGIISQIPFDLITVATTGREGRFDTPYGTISFTHTMISPTEIVANTIERPSHPLPLANVRLALKNQRSTHQNLELIDESWEDD
jgi:predicted transcriptional regulator of viral defense system